MMKPPAWNGSHAGAFLCGAFAQRDYPSLKVGHNVYGMIPAVMSSASDRMFRLPWAVAPISVPFVACIHIEMEFGFFGSTSPALSSMYAPILLRFALAFVCIPFACKEPEDKF